tara:strand:+ start:1510 stop:3003 length:1494 start_codon:yes stop_codon:yes gene_type:complete
MDKKIIFWLDAELTSFCLAYFLQKKLNAEFYAIIDVTNKPKEFFLNQKLVNFQKIWFYHDYMLKPVTSDGSLKENNSILNISELIKNDRIFNPKYNEFYKFTENEKKAIVSNEFNLFHEVLKIDPDIFVTGETALRPHHTFHKLCQSKNIKVLMVNNANWGKLSNISENYHRLDNLETLFKNRKDKSYLFEQLEKRLKDKILSKNLENYHDKNRKSKYEKFFAALNFLFFSNNDHIKTHYTYFGRTKIKVLSNEIKNMINYQSRQKYIDKNFSSNIPKNEKIIFFGMQQEPERSLLISTPKYTDQIKTIELIARSIPENYLLIVKEHPTQGPGRGWRDISEYEKLNNIPNVFLIHPTVPSTEIIKKSDLVISANGTISLEAAIFNTPSITFANDDFALISSIQKFNHGDDLEQLIEKTLTITVEPNEVGKYFDILEENSFSFDQLKFQLDYLSYFYFNGNLANVKINEDDMKRFLTLQEKNFSIVINELIQKIESYN